MRTSTTFLTFSGLASLSHLCSAAYTLQDDYNPDSFFDKFDFFTADDPTHGYVNYIDESAATSAGLAGVKNGQVFMGVDTSSVASGRGRDSVRITSKASYNAGSLIILDLAHMPGSVCGTWPAFWTVGPDWPNSGEIDIIEGVNSQTYNHYALHTSSGCSISNTGLFSGSIETPNCDVNAAGQANNAGCSIVTDDTTSYGDGFNAQQGGVYATEFTTQAVSIWYFPRSAIPSDITSGSPDPTGWGTPHASFGSPCQIGNFIKNQQIVFDTTFCGDWAANVWSTDATCSSKASTCQDFVQNNPSAFKESYWNINSMQVYSGSGSGVPVPGPSGSQSQQPTISGGVPTGQPSLPGGSASGWSQPSSLGPQDEPVSQNSWGGQGFGGRSSVSAWDGGSFQEPSGVANANAAETPAVTEGGAFYAVGSGSASVPASATGVANANAAVETAPATGGTVGTEPESGGGADVTVADTSDSANVSSGGDADFASPPEAAGNAGPPPTITSPNRPTRTCGSPWVRSSWSGRYVTVTALSDGDWENAKRDLERRDIEEAEVEYRRREKSKRGVEHVERSLEDEEVGQHVNRRHVHRHVGGRKRGLGGWW